MGIEGQTSAEEASVTNNNKPSVLRPGGREVWSMSSLQAPAEGRQPCFPPRLTRGRRFPQSQEGASYPGQSRDWCWLLEGALVVSIFEVWKPAQREEVTCSRLHSCRAAALDSHPGRPDLRARMQGHFWSKFHRAGHEGSSSAAGERALIIWGRQ